MDFASNGSERINLFALVVYIPDPLGRFLDGLRKELVPGCIPRAHVTILPPRPLSNGLESAQEKARTVADEFAPFDLEAGEVEIFNSTDVIYLALTRGDREVRAMNRALNGGPLAYQELFCYHPHITLAQNLAPDQVEPLCQLARRRWAEYSQSRRFCAERITFVQSTIDTTWVDLAEFSLGRVSLAR